MSDKQKILLASAEAVPFAKVGGMADVVGALPISLRKSGIDARVIMPGYGLIEHLEYEISLLFSFPFHHRQGASTVNVYTCIYETVPFYFVQAFPYFGNDASVYTEWTWDVPRFIFFNQVVMAVIWQLGEKMGWFPDLVHANDWHTGLLPFLISDNRWRPEWAEVASLMTIHNILYQGDHVWKYMWDAGIPPRNHPALAYGDLSDNMMAIGLAYADIITTVSPRYAQEIQHSTYGYGLTNLILSRQPDLHGVLNGIDAELWNPATDPHIVSNFDADNFESMRPPNKEHLQQSAGLEINPEIPLIGMVSRLTWQKGIDLAVPALHRILSETNAQFVLLGTGDASMERDFQNLQNAHPTQVRAYLHYDEALAQQIYAGSDMFLMPSHFEPCGIGQMLAMRYGSLPIVRETGGLADTVENYDNEKGDAGTGFVFLWESGEALSDTIHWAIHTFHHRQTAWQNMQRRAMNTDLSWEKSAKEYAELYDKAIFRHSTTGA